MNERISSLGISVMGEQNLLDALDVRHYPACKWLSSEGIGLAPRDIQSSGGAL